MSFKNDEKILNKDLSISSVIYSITIDQKFDINKIFNIYKNVKIFQKKKVNFKIDNPKATICIAENGYIRIMGLKSIKNSITSLETTLNNLAKQKAISEKYSIKKREIENIVVSGRIYDSIDLENVIPFLKNSMYEPDQFPGLIYRPGGKVTILLFASGKLVMVGARNINDINSEFIKIKEKLFAL